MEALRIDSFNCDVHNNYGVALLEEGQSEAAIAHYKEALRIGHSMPKPWTTWSCLCEKWVGCPIDRLFPAGRGMDPAFADAPCNLGNTLAGAGQLEAGSAYNRALQIKPDFPRH